MSQNKVKYRELCAQVDSIPIFMQPWWLDAVCTEGVSWDAILAYDSKERVIAALTFCIKKKWGFQQITMPHLTQYTGIWFDSQLEEQNARQKALKAIIKQIPHFHRLILRFNYHLKDWLPFYWAGFQQTTRYTYIIPDTQNLESVFNNFSNSIKHEIKKAEAIYTIKTSEDFDIFFKLKHVKDHTPTPIWKSLNTVLTEKQCRAMYLAENTEGGIDAAAYIIWDKNSTYYLASGMNKQGRKYHAMPLILWQAIQDSAHRTPIFDFEGSMIESIEPFFRKFGAVQMPYFQLSKFSNRWWEIVFRILNK